MKRSRWGDSPSVESSISSSSGSSSKSRSRRYEGDGRYRRDDRHHQGGYEDERKRRRFEDPSRGPPPSSHSSRGSSRWGSTPHPQSRSRSVYGDGRRRYEDDYHRRSSSPRTLGRGSSPGRDHNRDDRYQHRRDSNRKERRRWDQQHIPTPPAAPPRTTDITSSQPDPFWKGSKLSTSSSSSLSKQQVKPKKQVEVKKKNIPTADDIKLVREKTKKAMIASAIAGAKLEVTLMELSALKKLLSQVQKDTPTETFKEFMNNKV